MILVCRGSMIRGDASCRSQATRDCGHGFSRRPLAWSTPRDSSYVAIALGELHGPAGVPMLRNALAVGALIIGCHHASAQPLRFVPGPDLQRVDRNDLCVTNGVVSTQPNGRIAIDSSSSRAVIRIPAAQIAEVRFRY